MDYKDYINFIEQKENFENITINLRFIGHKILMLIGFIIGYTLLIKHLDPFYVLTDNFVQMNIFLKSVWVFISGTLMRHHYYIAFLHGELCYDISGLSYNSVNGKNDFYKSFDWYEMEIRDFRTRHRMKYWNMSTQKWLQRCVYKRYVEKLGSTKASMLT